MENNTKSNNTKSNNTKSNNSSFLESLRDVSGAWFVIIALAIIAGFLFAHWAMLMLVSALDAVVASAARHFTTVFTLPEVLFISGIVTVVICVLAIVRNTYYRQKNKPQPTRRPQQNHRTNRVVDIQEHRRKTQQPLQRFDVAK